MTIFNKVMKIMMPEKIKQQLNNDIEKLRKIDDASSKCWDGFKERRLTFDELGKLIHAGAKDIEIIFSYNTKSYWLYSNALDAYCDMDYEEWEQEESFIQKLVDDREYLFPLMGWVFGKIEL